MRDGEEKKEEEKGNVKFCFHMEKNGYIICALNTGQRNRSRESEL